MRFKYLIISLIALLVVVFAFYNRHLFIAKEKNNIITPYKLNFYHVDSIDGGKISILPQDEDNFTVLHVFSTWCQICNKEIKNLKKIQDKLNYINIIGLAINDNSSEVTEWLNSYDFSYNKLGILSKEEGEELGISGVPETLIMLKSGEIVSKRNGMLTVDLLKKDLDLIKNKY